MALVYRTSNLAAKSGLSTPDGGREKPRSQGVSRGTMPPAADALHVAAAAFAAGTVSFDVGLLAYRQRPRTARIYRLVDDRMGSC